MKQFKNFIFGLAILVATSLMAQPVPPGQSTYYKFTKTSGTYTPLPSGSKTVFQSGLQLNTDATSSEIILPFPFIMYGEPRDKVFLSNNGFINFGSAPYRNTIYNAISSSETLAKYLISCSNQIIASTDVGALPEISYGQNASGDMVFQFQDVSIQTGSLVKMNFQIILKSDGSTIQFMFGNCRGQDQTSNVSVRSFEIGARDVQQGTGTFKKTVAGKYNNFVLGSGDWNKITNANLGTQPSSGMSVRTGVDIPGTSIPNMVKVANSGTIYELSISNQ